MCLTSHGGKTAAISTDGELAGNELRFVNDFRGISLAKNVMIQHTR